MAGSLWGKVYYKDDFAGLLQQEPSGRCVFTYDKSYIDSKSPAIAFSLPLRQEPFTSEHGLHPFFDNLVAEGWFQNAQARALGINVNNRFALLLGFGHDLAGAVSVEDPEPRKHIEIDHTDDATRAAILGRASLSGVQRKLLVIQEGNHYRPVRPNELSTHLAKLSSGTHKDIIELEYLTTEAVRKLLPNDNVVELEISPVSGVNGTALVIKRFDRVLSNEKVKRIHFEEFNSLLGHFSDDSKYEGSYEDMGLFIAKTPSCLMVEVDKFYRRILACLLVGNTDAHFKNFAMFHTRDGLRLTPAYDLVAAARYKEFNTIALSIGKSKNLIIGELKAKHLIDMGLSFGLNEKTIRMAVNDLGEKLSLALAAISSAKIENFLLKEKLSEMMEKRWKGSFDSIGQLLSKRQSKGESSKS